MAWHTLFGGLDSACSKGFSPRLVYFPSLSHLNPNLKKPTLVSFERGE
ncbi:hypothetical protein MC7420_5830 [Coleofasciculus chthonoplastes PCC 7420]|uniref:Uncharacterized protein n=1 Tax=Coleofasciculus chthonoplastes PCC 7420 TaxID=118168 RepID=B4VW16_9CYAN|nr:hypothetical protein MC7420_5830 [Coleofasciculus chthonoplastes PCC 7420]